MMLDEHQSVFVPLYSYLQYLKEKISYNFLNESTEELQDRCAIFIELEESIVSKT